MTTRSHRRSAYLEKLRDPRWQKRRLEILDRDDWRCRRCFDSEHTLHVHHVWYAPGGDPWDVTDDGLLTLCERCHADEEYRAAVETRLLRALRRRFGVFSVEMIADALEDALARPGAPAWRVGTPGVVAAVLVDADAWDRANVPDSDVCESVAGVSEIRSE